MTYATPLLSLIPASGIQFLDVDFDIEALPRIGRAFWDEKPLHLRDAAGDQQVFLRALEEGDEGELYDPVGQQHPPEEEVYRITRSQALEPFLGRWVPLPYLRVDSQGAEGAVGFDVGPTNWVRVRIVEMTGLRGVTHRAILAFDTSLVERQGERYTGPSPDDASGKGEFRLATRMADNAGFLAEGWFGQWVEGMFLDLKRAQRRGREVKPEELPYRMEPWARFLTLLDVLVAAQAAPRIRLVDAGIGGRKTPMVDVDLVLDIGNARTCGILVESSPDGPLSLNDSYPLALRDLTRPEFVWQKPFESRVEFSRAVFGDDALSRRSGRAGAFTWPSPLRVGPEAVRLAGQSIGNEGATGLSSPKRYLWDERPSSLGWRFAAARGPGAAPEPPVTGGFMMALTETGEVVSRSRNAAPAIRARFSRSSLYTLMLAEILLQAIGQINAPATRAARRNADVPRRLRRVILTLPTAMPVAEQRIARRRAEHAVELVWDLMGWSAAAAAERAPAAPVPPRVSARLDEATATQLVWLYAESVHRLQADARQLFGLMGRVREGYGASPSLRIASIDIGGGTTDLAVTTFALAQDQEIRPTQNFREGFKIAGDDLLQTVIERMVLPPLEQALGEAGLREPKSFLRRVLGGARGGQAESERQLTRQFVARVLEPCALALLSEYETLTAEASGPFARLPLAAGPGRPRHDRAIAFFERIATDAGAVGFTLDAVEVPAEAGAMDGLVRGTLGPVLADLCEAAHAFDCDVLLLSGRPSRLRAVTDVVLAKLPVPAHRIVHMQGYAAGGWYPFRDSNGRIEDPKTTAAVGAMLATLAEGSLPGFLLRSSRLGMKSTARFIGRLETSGQLLHRNEYLRDIDLDVVEDGAPLEVEIPFEAPSILGFRQLPLERWPAMPLYALEFSNPDEVRNLALPLKVRLARAPMEGAEAEAAREQFKPVSVRDADDQERHPTTVRMRLQTMRDDAGYWRDTGALGVP